MSVIFDALQQSEHLTNQVKKTAIDERIVTDGKIQKKKIILVVTTLLLLSILIWSYILNINVLNPIRETELTISDKDLSQLINSDRNDSEINEIEINHNRDNVIENSTFEPVGVFTNPLQSLAPPVMVVKNPQLTSSEIVSKPRTVTVTEAELAPVQEVISSDNDDIFTVTAEINREIPPIRSVDTVENVSIIVNQIKSVIRSGNIDQLDSLFTTLEQKTGNDSVIYLKLRGYSMLMQDSNIEAKLIYENLLTQYPDELELNLNMALLEMRIGQSSQALKRLNRIKSIYPESTEINKYIQQVEVGS